MKKTQREEAMDLATAEAVRILTEAVGKAVCILAGGRVDQTNRATAEPGEIMTKEEVRVYLRLPSIRSVERYMRTKKLPYYKMSRQAARFLKSEVDEAVKRSQVKAASAAR